MPPKSARKGTSVLKRGGSSRATKARGLAKAEEVPASASVELEEEKKVEVEEEVREQEEKEVREQEEKEESKEVEVEKVESKLEADPVGGVDAEYEEDGKENYEEEDKSGRLELEDNEPEYEPEEEIAVDYDERYIEHYEGQEEGDDAVEYAEEGDVAEEEPEMADEELEDMADDVEGEEFENTEAEQDVDAAQEEHEVVKEHRKRKEFEVFVGGLDKDATESELRKVFGEVGEIEQVRLMMNPATKKNKGFAFLRYATVEQARRCVKELRKPLVRGKPCGVAPSHDNDTLFVGNICQTWTKDDLKEKLKSYGVDNYDDLVLVEDKDKEGKNRGYALLEFSTRTDAVDAFKCLQKRDVFFGVDRAAKVSFADSYPELDDEIMAQVTTVFVDGVPSSWDEDRVRQYLKKYGAIEKVELARNMPAAKRKDFGFVTFDTHDNAIKCAEAINNADLGEGDNKVRVRARLSRPLQRPRMKRGPRGSYRMGSGGPSRVSRFSYSRPLPSRRPPPLCAPRFSFSHMPPPVRRSAPKRPLEYRDRRPVMAVPERPRRLPPPERSHVRHPPAPVYTKSSSRRDYVRRDEVPPPRTGAAADYTSRAPAERRTSFRDEYPPRGPAYSDISPRSVPRTAERRAYADDNYAGKIERPTPYRDARNRDYDTISGSKRPYADMDDASPRYHDVSIRHTKPRLEYDVGGSASARYSDPYGDRLARSHMGYSSSRAVSGPDMYSSRHGMSYGGGSVGSSDIGMYQSNFGSNYFSRGSDVGGSSYSMYSSRNVGSGSGYYSGSGSSPHY